MNILIKAGLVAALETLWLICLWIGGLITMTTFASGLGLAASGGLLIGLFCGLDYI